MWLITLDFLSGRARTHTSKVNQVAVKACGDLTTLLAHRNPAIREGLETGKVAWPTGAQPLVSLEGVSTPEFVMCAIAEAVSCKGRHANPWVREETVRAMARVVRGFADDACGESMVTQGDLAPASGHLYLQSKIGRYRLQGQDVSPSTGPEGAMFRAAWDVGRGEWVAARA
jgi:hypothetical protein